MPAERRYGMDHDHYDWSPIVNRDRLEWPNGARIAVCVIVNLEHVEWRGPDGSYQVPNLSGGITPRPFPDYARFSHREYGHRVGIFRVLNVLGKYKINSTVAMDSFTAANYPYLVKYCLDQGSEIIAHGISVSQMITSKMGEQAEREYIQSSIKAIRRATGTMPRGWLGPEFGESVRTPQLLAEMGVRYVCDFANDEQPYPMKTVEGDLLALPVMLELDDTKALWDRRVPVSRYGAVLKESFDVMYRDGSENGRLLVLNLHPWLIGQPHRIRYLDDSLGYIMARQGVWAATGSEITDWYMVHCRKNEVKP